MTPGAPLVLFAGGGTGGHLFPSLSVASALTESVSEVRFVFFTTNRSIDGQVVSASGYERVPQLVRPLQSSKPWRWPGFLLSWTRSRRACRRWIVADRPAIVVGSGGFASGPAVCEARRAGIPVALLNPDLVPGKANRYLASRADRVFAQWEESAAYFPGHPGVRITGCPVRPQFAQADRAAGVSRFGLRAEKKTLLITGASLGARSINDAVVAMLDDPACVQGWQVLHLTGTADEARVSAAYAERGICGRVLSFTEHMADALAASDLVLSRAGASTLAEITALGRPSILMPYPHHRDRHQESNAGVLARCGAARIVPDQVDSQKTVPALRKALIEWMMDDDALRRAASAARDLGRPDAAAAVARELVELIGGAAPKVKRLVPSAR